MRRTNPATLAAILPALLATLTACNTPTNPAFDLTRAQAQRDITWMTAYKRPLHRPVLVLAGYGPGIEATLITNALTEVVTNPNQLYNPDTPNIIPVSFVTTGSFDAAAKRVIQRLEQHHPSQHPHLTVEVDVVGSSMGGLIARHAATPATIPTPPRNETPPTRKRLNIHTLYTIATPHNGAKSAPRRSLDRRVQDMHPDSRFLATLNTRPEPFPTVAYARLGDAMVGVHNTGANNEPPYWVPNAPLELAHIQASSDPRILADIMKRLRRETPYTAPDPAELPDPAQP